MSHKNNDDDLKDTSSVEYKLGLVVEKEPHINSIRLFGMIVIFLFFGGFFIWAYLSPLESASIAQGKVVVAGNRRTIQHLEGGIVAKIYVKDGMYVKKGQVLIKLDDVQSSIRLQVMRNKVYELLANEARLIAEAQGESKITFPQRLLENKNSLQQILNSQESMFISDMQSNEGMINVLKQRILQIEEQIKGVESQLISSSRQRALIEDELKDVRVLYQKQLVERSKLLALEREQAGLIGAEGEHTASISNLRQQIGQTTLEIISKKDEVRKKILDELSDTREQLSKALEEEKSALEIYNRSNIVAPIEGTVVSLLIHTIGGVIKAGEPIMDIVPQNEQLIVEVRVIPTDIDVVHAGLEAKVSFSGLQMRTTPTLVGKVTYVSPDALVDQQKGETYYLAKVEIGKHELDKLGKKVLYPGMPAEVMIITNNSTPMEYFLAPITRSFNHAFREE